MKKYLVWISLIAVVSTLAAVIAGAQNAEKISEETDDDLMINHIGV